MYAVLKYILDFLICLKFILFYKILNVGMSFWNPQNLFKEAMSSFGVMCKAIVYSIQSRLLYRPTKYQGRATDWTRVIFKFQGLLKIENCLLYSLCATFLCAHGILKRRFVRPVKSIYKTMHLHRIFLHTTYCYYGEANVTDGSCLAALV